VCEMTKDFRLKSPRRLDACPFLKYPKIISVSGKGGVGKTNLVINLAFAFAKLHRNIFVLDGDLGLPNIHTLLGLIPKYTISHLIRAQEIPWKFRIEGKGGITILPGSSEGFEFLNLGEREKLNLIEKIELITNGADIILMDTESGLSSNVVFFNMISTDNVIIITPEPTSINNAQALIRKLSSTDNKRKFAILVNFAQNRAEAVNIFKSFTKIIDNSLGRIVSIELLGFVPFDEKLQKAIRIQRAVIEMWPQAPSSCCFMEIARSILESTPKQTGGTGPLFAFKPAFEVSLLPPNMMDDKNQQFNLKK
jgi:flagellar biosynthesis protein FlhG